MATQGLFIDPQELQQAQDLAAAQLTPEQRLYMMGRGTGRAIGQGLGGFFGVNVQDPAMARATKLRELGAKYGTTTAEALDNIAAEIQATDPAMAMQVKAKADEMRASAAELKVKEARAKNLTSGVGKLNPQNYTAESWARYAESGDLGDLVDRQRGAAGKGPIGNISPKDFTPESMQAFLNTVTTGNPDYSLLERVKPAEKELPATLVAKAADIDANITKLNNSVSKIDALGTRINALDLGLIQNFSRGGAAWLGINTKDRLDFDATRRVALNEANNLLLLAKGTQTEGDAQRARDQIADENTWKNKDALKAAFQDLKDTHKATVDALSSSRKTLVSQGKTPAPTPAAAPKPVMNTDRESMISKFMAANPNKTRQQVEAFMKSKGFLKD